MIYVVFRSVFALVFVICSSLLLSSFVVGSFFVFAFLGRQWNRSFFFLAPEVVEEIVKVVQTFFEKDFLQRAVEYFDAPIVQDVSLIHRQKEIFYFLRVWRWRKSFLWTTQRRCHWRVFLNGWASCLFFLRFFSSLHVTVDFGNGACPFGR